MESNDRIIRPKFLKGEQVYFAIGNTVGEGKVLELWWTGDRFRYHILSNARFFFRDEDELAILGSNYPTHLVHHCRASSLFNRRQ